MHSLSAVYRHSTKENGTLTAWEVAHTGTSPLWVRLGVSLGHGSLYQQYPGAYTTHTHLLKIYSNISAPSELIFSKSTDACLGNARTPTCNTSRSWTMKLCDQTKQDSAWFETPTELHVPPFFTWFLAWLFLHPEDGGDMVSSSTVSL